MIRPWPLLAVLVLGCGGGSPEPGGGGSAAGMVPGGATSAVPGGTQTPGVPSGGAPAGSAAPAGSPSPGGAPVASGTPSPTGTVDATAGTTPVATPAVPTDPGLGPEPSSVLIRRLTNKEYEATVADLFPGLALPEFSFTADPIVSGLQNLSSEQNSNVARIEQYESTAEAVAAVATADPDTLTGCNSAAMGEAECGLPYLHDLARRAYRRPLEAAEQDAISNLFILNADTESYATRLGLVIRGILQSPKFLFRPEIGAPGGGEVVSLTSFELATRLSYLITGSMPDADLFAAAEAGQLQTPDQVLAQATRLLALPAAREHLVDFHELWLGIQRISALTKDQDAYPNFTPSLAVAMGEETQRFLEFTLFSEPGGSFRDLFTAPYSFVNAQLADFYGVPAPAEDWAQTSLDPTQRAGLLTQASLLATMAKDGETDPVRRGKFVLGQITCQTIAPPPPDVVAMFPPMDLSLTMRDRFAAHSESPTCAGCHVLIDPIGLTFEHYDAVGAWRDDDRGMPLDVTGEIFGTPVDGAIELSAVVAENADARTCYLTQWFRFTFGRLNVSGNAEDEAQIAFLSNSFTADKPLRDIVGSMVQSTAFRFVRPGLVDATGSTEQ